MGKASPGVRVLGARRAGRERLGARALGVPVELRYLAVPFEELWRRVEARNGQGAFGVVPITRETLEGYVPFFDEPGPEEAALFDAAPGPP